MSVPSPVLRTKPSDLGRIPDDWEVDTISNLGGKVTSGSRGWAEFYSEYGSLFVRIANLRRSNIHLDLSSCRYVSPPANNSEANRTRLQVGDVLISITADIGIIGYVDESIPHPAYINQHIARVRFSHARALSKFVAYYLSSWGPQRIFIGSTDTGAKAGMNLLTVGSLKTVVPPLVEQERIGSILSDADELIAKLERLITKKQAIKQGMMQQLMTGRIRLPGFYGPWERVQLGALLKRRPRYGVNAAAVPNTVGVHTYIRITDIDDSGRFTPRPKVSVRHPNASDYLLRPGELVFARTGASVGKSYLYDPQDGDLIYAGFLINIAPDTNLLEPEYLAVFAQTAPYWAWVARTSARSGQPGINGREYAQLEMTLPDIREQRAIAGVLRNVDSEIHILGGLCITLLEEVESDSSTE